MKTARTKILDLLDKKGVMSVAELSRALKTTPANIRHHLSVLVTEGAVELVAQRPAEGRGRPAHLYARTSLAQSHNLDGLASALLLELTTIETQFPAGIDPLDKLAQRMAGAAGKPELSLNQRLFSAVQKLNDQHYQARWEARAEAPRVILGHCPYAAILPEHPELCRMDAGLLAALLQHKVRQTHRLAQDSSGARNCIFALEKK